MAEKSAIKKITKRVVKEKKPKVLKVEIKNEDSVVSADLKQEEKERALGAGKYIESVGRRKTATARVRIFSQGGKDFSVNEKPLNKYFADLETQKIAQDSLVKMNCEDKFCVSVRVKGGGLHAQAEAIRHGIARALVLFNFDFKKRLKRAGFLTRDPRMRERKKFGLKRARKSPQWAKR